jgi:hypothetical protein
MELMAAHFQLVSQNMPPQHWEDVLHAVPTMPHSVVSVQVRSVHA